jgi:hypothetical protein
LAAAKWRRPSVSGEALGENDHGGVERVLWTWSTVSRDRRLAPFLAPAELLGIPGYTDRMAKVMVSLPDDLLAEVDAEARRGGTTRSAVMRGFADAAMRKRRESRAAAMRSLLSGASPHGGRAAALVKSTRPGP